MNRQHEESFVYNLSYRSIMNLEKNIKVFTEKNFIEVKSEIDFDIDDSHKSAVNYFVTSVIGGIMQNIITSGKREKINIDEFESVTKIKIENPLTVLGVKGYEEEPKISECNIKMYIHSDLEDDDLINFCNKNLKKCILYNTLKNTVKFTISFIPIL